MRHGSLFSGGGGFDLAAECMRWENVFHSDIDSFCNRLLNYYWSHAVSIGDIRKFDGTPFNGQIDILTGGFPCQPFSNAGKRKGTADSRHLWPEMLRVIREIRPRWVVGENVYGLLNWNGGLVFEQIHLDLEAAGYEVQAFILPACGVNAPHRRYRIWFVAHRSKRDRLRSVNSDAHNYGLHKCYSHNEKHSGKGRKHAQRDFGAMGNDANSYCPRLERRSKAGDAIKGWKKQIQQFARLSKSGYWNSWAAQSPLCGGNDGLPDELDGITFPKWRKESIKMYGNAIVPQVALQIFRAIEAYERISKQ